jgi:hypothetical protein
VIIAGCWSRTIPASMRRLHTGGNRRS